MTPLTTLLTLAIGILIAGTVAGTVAYSMNYMMRADDVAHRIILGTYVIVPSVGLIARGENPTVVIISMFVSIIIIGRYTFGLIKPRLPQRKPANQQ